MCYEKPWWFRGVHLDSSPHRLHVSCYAVHGVGIEGSLRLPTCGATVQSIRPTGALGQRRDDVIIEALTVVRQAMPAG